MLKMRLCSFAVRKIQNLFYFSWATKNSLKAWWGRKRIDRTAWYRNLFCTKELVANVFLAYSVHAFSLMNWVGTAINFRELKREAQWTRLSLMQNLVALIVQILQLNKTTNWHMNQAPMKFSSARIRRVLENIFEHIVHDCLLSRHSSILEKAIKRKEEQIVNVEELLSRMGERKGSIRFGWRREYGPYWIFHLTELQFSYQIQEKDLLVTYQQSFQKNDFGC